MQLGIYIDNGKRGSLSIPLSNPHSTDISDIMKQIEKFTTHTVSTDKLDIPGLIPKMIHAVRGCENGCPGDALRFVRNGHPPFSVEYVEGGIVTARHRTPGKPELSLKLFPEF
jgi:hypothetical protein